MVLTNKESVAESVDYGKYNMRFDFPNVQCITGRQYKALTRLPKDHEMESESVVVCSLVSAFDIRKVKSHLFT